MSRLRLLLGPRTPPTAIGPQPVFRMGMNISGMELAPTSGGPKQVTSDELNFWRAKQVPAFRLPIDWNQIQPTLGGDLSSAYLGQLDTIITTLAGNGGLVMPDIHGFGRGPGGVVGVSGGPTFAQFADLWSKIATWIQAKPSRVAAVDAVDLMNEWHGMSATGQDDGNQDFTLAFQANQAAVLAVRQAGYRGKIILEGNHYSSPGVWTQINANWDQINDPLNNKIYHAHCYFDRDGSGTHFSYAEEVAAGAGQDWPSFATGPNPMRATNPQIGVQRLQPFVDWCKAKGVRGGVGEMGWSNDFPVNGLGIDNFAAWNTMARNTLAYCQANGIEVFAWCAGPEFPGSYGGGYEYNPTPTSTNPRTTSAPDFTDAGLSSTQRIVIDDFTGYTGAQPKAYRVDTPIGAVPYAPSGSPIPNFKIRYNGRLAASTALVPHARLHDGTDAGGTFSPTVIPAGDNCVLAFSYTPAASYPAIEISFTNSAGWIDPPIVGCSSQADLFTPLGTKPVNVFGLRRLVNTYVGPAIRLQRASDNTQKDFYFNNRGDLPRNDIQTWASSRSIPVVTIYDQMVLSDIVHVGGSAFSTLTLVNAAGYPEITHPANAQYNFVSPCSGNTQQTIMARVNDGNGSPFFLSQDGTGYPFRFSPNEYQVANNTGNIKLGRVSSEWHHYGATFTAGGTQVGYKDGVQSASQAAPSTPLSNQNAGTALGYFPYYTSAYWTGAWQNIVILSTALTATQEKTFSDADATYYSTALPDTLNPPPAAPAETPYDAPSGTFTPRNYKGVNLGNMNTNYPTSNIYVYWNGEGYDLRREINYLGPKGFGVVRVPVTGQRLQPVTYGLLDPLARPDSDARPTGGNMGTAYDGHLGSLKWLLDTALTQNMRVIIDMHDYGRVVDSKNGTFRTIGADPEGTAIFVDLWTRVATKFKNYPNVVFGLMNEPYTCTAQQFHDAAAAAIAAIRAAGANQLILIAGGGNYDDAEPWASTMGTIWDTFNQPGWTGTNGDPANNFAFEGHKYLNGPGGGSQYGNDGNGSAYRNVTGSQVLGGMTTWCRQTNAGVARANPFKAFLGEMGWVPDSTVSSRSGQTAPAALSGQTAVIEPSVPNGSMLDFMSANSDVWIGWTFYNGGAWAFENSYQWGHVVPVGYSGAGPYTDQPQMALLTGHL